MTLVADKVSEKLNQGDATNESVVVQMPCVVSTLRKKIYFPHLTKIYQTRATNQEDDQTIEEKES